ncbi:MAG: MBL fold metallo-hydrolase [Chthoniobacterales bacterium]
MQIQFLGQSGFLIHAAGKRLVIDPYLSDSVAEKFGAQNARQVPVVVTPAQLAPLDFVLLTHAHLDHTDPQTLGPLAAASPAADFFAPYECRALLVEWGLGRHEISAPPAEWNLLAPGLEVRAIPAAHLELERNAAGEPRSIGWLLRADGITLYHAGDTIPHPEIFASLAGERIDYALLPVNERNFYRDRDGIVGNMTVREAFRMAADLGVRTLIPIHWDMFAPNRVHPAEIELLYNLETPPFSLEVMQAGALKLLGSSQPPNA